MEAFNFPVRMRRRRSLRTVTVIARNTLVLLLVD